jgi:hypothetical protein
MSPEDGGSMYLRSNATWAQCKDVGVESASTGMSPEDGGSMYLRSNAWIQCKDVGVESASTDTSPEDGGSMYLRSNAWAQCKDLGVESASTDMSPEEGICDCIPLHLHDETLRHRGCLFACLWPQIAVAVAPVIW